MNSWATCKMNDSDLANTFSDYYKDVHGFRPQNFPTDRAYTIAQLEKLDAIMAAKTPTQLSDEGWS